MRQQENWKQSLSRYVRTSWQPQRVVYLARLTLDSFKEVFNRFQALPEKYDPQCFYEQVRTRLKLEVKRQLFIDLFQLFSLLNTSRAVATKHFSEK